MNIWTEDSDIRRIFDWLINCIGKKEWLSRKSYITRKIDEESKYGYNPIVSSSLTNTGYFEDDPCGWYFYLLDTYLTNPTSYEFTPGARVVPLFKILGRYFELLKTIKGLKERVQKMVTKNNDHPDGNLFELLVALVYLRNGWDSVTLLPGTPKKKTPDIHVKGKDGEWFVECKKMVKSATYSAQEREKWRKMWRPLGTYLDANGLPFRFDIAFHVELVPLDDSFLKQELIPKLKFVCSPCLLIDNEIWTVRVNFVDYEKIEQRMSKMDVRTASSSLSELILGEYDPNRGRSYTVRGKLSGKNKNYFEDISFAAGAVWNCDSAESINKKARDIRQRLLEATEQLPDNKQGVVHIGLETHDGEIVEKKRHKRIVDSVLQHSSSKKDLQWIYCHIFDPRVPPDKNWDFGETVYYFSKTKCLPEPIKWRSVALPHDAEISDGAPWL